jgi:hypothetical protein
VLEHGVDEVVRFENNAEETEDGVHPARADLCQVSPVKLRKRQALSAGELTVADEDGESLVEILPRSMRVRKMAHPGVVVVSKAARFHKRVGEGPRRITGVCLAYPVRNDNRNIAGAAGSTLPLVHSLHPENQKTQRSDALPGKKKGSSQRRSANPAQDQ